LGFDLCKRLFERLRVQHSEFPENDLSKPQT